jgi:hypothetical protein
MGPGFGAAVFDDFLKGVVVALIVVFFLGVATAVLAPKAWRMAKPVIHRMTE